MPDYAFACVDATGANRKFTVSFPYDAYDAQIVFIERALEAMCRKQSALLESPTGTGKTLCLLSAALAYARNEGRAKKSRARAREKASTSETVTEEFVDAEVRRERERAPTIVYATRTHSQVRQVLGELKVLDSNTRATTLASRKHACAREDVRALVGDAQNNRCSKLVAERKCGAKNVLDMSLNRKGIGEKFDVFEGGVRDIEDLVISAQKSRGPCPFYLSRTKCADAEIIFMPYNYLLNDTVRRGLDIVWEDAVVIVDEAHNLESSAADSMSYSLTAAKLAKAIQETNSAWETKLTVDDNDEEGVLRDDQKELFKRGMGEEASAFGSNDVLELGRTLLQLEEVLDGVCREASTKSGKSGTLGECVEDGAFIYNLLERVGITQFTYQRAVTIMKGAAKMVQLGSDFMEAATGTHKETPLTEIANFIERLFTKRADQYFVTRVGPDTDNFKTSQRQRQGPTLSYWCFFPGLCLKELIEKNVGSFLLASGTLSPMESFSSELAMEFPVRLENPHVIQRNQIWGGVLTHGPGGNVLNSSFRFRDTDNYKKEIGSVILSTAKIVPDGLLVFFPSYGVMNSCIDHWRFVEGGLWAGIEASKTCFIEPSNSEEFQECYKRYNEALNDGTRRGAIFFAVCRGKVSEGIDFADKACRGVILTGIPYAGAKDPLVMHKRSFLDKRRANDGESYSGNEWYSQTAMRAVNQALGRAIRHKNDFGAVILADERFANENARNQLSLWLRPSIQVHSVFNSVVSGLRDFFQSNVGSVASAKPAPAKFVDIAVVKAKAKADTMARKEKSKASIASLVRQFSKDQGDDEDEEARKKFMLVSKRTVPLQAKKLDLFGAAREKQTREAQRKSPLLMQLARSRGEETDNVGQVIDDENAELPSEERTKLFMRRAKLELSRDAYNELVSHIDKVNTDEFDIRDLLRVASRVLKAPENPKGLYALFGEFVPSSHKPIYEKHRQALIERQEKVKAQKIAAGGPSQLVVVAPPNACVVCSHPCDKPFFASACKHVACYKCWLDKVVKPRGPGVCPSCSAEVLKRHLEKKFF